VQISAMPIRPLHHGGNAEFMVGRVHLPTSLQLKIDDAI